MKFMGGGFPVSQIVAEDRAAKYVYQAANLLLDARSLTYLAQDEGLPPSSEALRLYIERLEANLAFAKMHRDGGLQ